MQRSPLDLMQDLEIIVPVGPHESAWPHLLRELTRMLPGVRCAFIFAEEIPARFSRICRTLRTRAMVRAMATPAGRARQLNHGARTSYAKYWWLLHADSHLTPQTDLRLREFLDSGEDSIGYFDLRFLPDGPRLMAFNALGAWLRSRLLHLPFGDQGLVVSRTVYERLGGFDEDVACGEDLLFIKRARRSGVPIAPIGALLLTSARRYREFGWLRTTVRHLSMAIRLNPRGPAPYAAYPLQPKDEIVQRKQAP